MPGNYIDIHKQLVDRCRTNDRQAQYELYSLYAKAMYNVCIRIVNHTSEAEDILQEAFLEAFTRLDEFRSESSFGAWIKKIVVNKSINYLKKRKLVLVDELANEKEIVREEYFDDEHQQWEVQRVLSTIRTLPDGYRVILTLYLIEGYDHEEIARILNITESTSKSQYSRAKEHVRTQLKKKNHAQ